MVASSRARGTGWRKSQSSTSGPTLIVVVTTAAAARAASGPGPSSKWSGTKSVEYPRSSTSRNGVGPRPALEGLVDLDGEPEAAGVRSHAHVLLLRLVRRTEPELRSGAWMPSSRPPSAARRPRRSPRRRLGVRAGDPSVSSGGGPGRRCRGDGAPRRGRSLAFARREHPGHGFLERAPDAAGVGDARQSGFEGVEILGLQPGDHVVEGAGPARRRR